ncbi:MAG: hypothetical protein HUK09_08445, partial [Bacteroidaceae bacterium]|nr:hypothetical protein [Bacteroidaceae bacterium]
SVTLEACDLDAPTPLQLLPANAMRLHPLAGEAPTLVMATAPLRQPSAWSRMWQNWGDFWVRYRKNAFWALAVAFGLLAVFALLDNLDKFQCSSDKTEEVTTTPDPAAPVVEAPVEEPSLLGGDTTAEEKPIEVPKPKAPVIKTEELPEPVELETMPRNEHEPAPAVPATPSEPKPAETPKPAAPAAPKPTEQAKPKPTETPKPAQPKPAEPAGPLKES